MELFDMDLGADYTSNLGRTTDIINNETDNKKHLIVERLKKLNIYAIFCKHCIYIHKRNSNEDPIEFKKYSEMDKYLTELENKSPTK